MIPFWTAAALLVAVALAFLLPPLIRRPVAGPVTGDGANLSVYRDQRDELDGDLARGTISARQHAQARTELEQRLLEDVRAPGEPYRAGPPRSTRTVAIAAALGIAVPLVAIALYLGLGKPEALDPATRLGMSEQEAADRRKMLELTAQLAKKMAGRANDATGWSMLGRSYLGLGKPAEAALAYGRAAALKPQDAGAQADLAEALALSDDGRVGAAAFEAATRALAIDPKQQKALALLGTAAFEAKNYRRVIVLWERLLAEAPAGSEFAHAVEAGIAEARAALAAAGKPAGTPARVSGRVELAGPLRARASPDDTVFVFARAATGPRMPLAILRKRVRDLPAEFMLDDSMAMAPGMQLSGFPLVVVGARVSKSGGALPARGDLEGLSGEVRPGTGGIAVVIDRVVP